MYSHLKQNEKFKSVKIKYFFEIFNSQDSIKIVKKIQVAKNMKGFFQNKIIFMFIF
jgi:hypothetical protein